LPRYEFGPFIISPARRVLVRHGTEVPLIPRYFDLLVLLVRERHRAVSKQDIFDAVWKDVIVSDGALSQAIRTIRRALDDDVREPTFVKTVARHGYQFIYEGVVEAEERAEGDRRSDEERRREDRAGPRTDGDRRPEDRAGLRTALIQRLLSPGTDDERRGAAEQLHAMGTAEALAELDRLPGHERARAILRDTRWDVAGAGEVPIVGAEGTVGAAMALVRLRLRRAARIASSRWASASAGGALAGLLAGAIGGIAFLLVPESGAQPGIVAALGTIGAAAGAFGAAGVGAGLAAAEALFRSRRALGLACCGAVGGAAVGALAHLLARALSAGVFGQDLAGVGGALEGLALGGAAGIGYGTSTALQPGGGMAAPQGAARARTALVTGVFCAIAGIGITLAGGTMVAASLDVAAGAFQGSQVGLGPIASLLGEGTLRPVTGTLISAFEGLLFGAGLAFGLTHRPRL
jgi:DNA-binding winged helix-turn-helix (wHTH) protein